VDTDTTTVSTFVAPVRPAWTDDLLAAVGEAFASTGALTPGWPDPHPDRSPLDEEYSRVSDQGKYRILHARIAAWVQVLDDRGLATTTETSKDTWIGDVRSSDHVSGVQQVLPTRPGGAALLVASTLVDGAPFGLDIALAAGETPVLMTSVPGCGCDACDSGSDDQLTTVDEWVLSTARGGVLHARGPGGHVTRRFDGWEGSGAGSFDSWLDESAPAPPGVVRWYGEPWL
jgi:hypothetical protein